jgi:hypothetical protein
MLAAARGFTDCKNNFKKDDKFPSQWKTLT